jgi:ABC-type proline/glycine betaine transport system permease subunit
MFLGCLGCGGLGQIVMPGIDPKVQAYVVYGAAALVIFGVGFYVLSRR